MTILGFLNIDKPSGMTSHDVVARVRRQLKIKKVGHAGTLDPMATGVLVLCMGAATRLSDYVMHATKQYQAQVRLGATTDTYDAEGEITAEHDSSHITRETVEQAITDFRGDIEQVPPMYSAIKQEGKKLYELARAGQTVERPPRPVRIDSLHMTDWSPPEITLDITCSAGTYIRSLAYDLGETLGVGAHLTGLTRTTSGNFRLTDAVTLNTLLESDNWQDYLISPRVALAHLPIVCFDTIGIDHLLHGRSVPDDQATMGTVAQAYGPNDEFVAIIEGNGQAWRPRKVFPVGDKQ
jgi:tRNA pseudouridine55 synthase